MGFPVTLFATSEEQSVLAGLVGPAQEAWGPKRGVMQYVRDSGCPEGLWKLALAQVAFSAGLRA